MRSRWRIVLIGIVLIGIVIFLWTQQAWLLVYLADLGTFYLNQVKGVLPIIIGTLVASFSILALEIIVLGWQKSSLAALLKPSKSALNDLFLWFLSISQIWVILAFIITQDIFLKIRPAFRELLGIEQTIFPQIESGVLQLVIFIVFIDFISYVLHYFMHFIPPFWHFHKVHHAATEFNGITSERAHPIETNLVAEMVFTIPFAIMGFPLIDVSIYVGIRHFLAMLHHSRLEWDWGWIGKYLLVSPQYHRIHHSILPEHFNKNIAIIFSFWDHLFGTYCGDRIELSQIGVSDNQYNKKHVIHDFFLSFRELREATFRKRSANGSEAQEVAGRSTDG